MTTNIHGISFLHKTFLVPPCVQKKKKMKKETKSNPARPLCGVRFQLLEDICCNDDWLAQEKHGGVMWKVPITPYTPWCNIF